ncbi:MAG: hypothetical protein LBM70_05555 [Victivallales bacterium]|jgi:hypothetical protein|nr:hypothetical protein [Victivallales bacterium]
MHFEKENIKLVLLGHAKHLVDTSKLLRYKSNFFHITDPVVKEKMPDKKVKDSYLNIEYSKEEVTSILSDITSESIVIGIMAYPYNDNFYMHRLGGKKCCISLANINHILRSEKISTENFIIKNIFEVVLLYNLFGSVSIENGFHHNDTRGCIFDMCGDTDDIIYNTEKPIICDECKGKIINHSLPEGYLAAFEKELAQIDKTPSQKFEIWVGEHPFLYSLIILIVNIFLTIGINIFTNYLCK